MKKVLLLVLPVAILATSCWYVGGKRVRGNGNVKTETRPETGFTGVDSYGSFDVYVSVDSENSIRIEAEENLLPYIETYVEGDLLKIRTKRGYNISSHRGMKVFVKAPHFSRLHTYGSGNIIGETKISSPGKMDLGITGSADIKMDIDAPEVEAEITGSGNIVLNGQTKRFESRVSGSGDIRALDLKSEEAEVRISGSGNTDIYASVRLDVRVSGSGDVRYKGGAQVNTHISGSGNVRKMD